MNFDPATVKLAMEQMKNLSPEQIRQMMNNLPPSMAPEMRAAANNIKDMPKEDWERACNQFKDSDPDTIARQAAEAQSKLSSYGDYVIQASNQLKTEGNEFHKKGEYTKALEKYTKAKDNVAEIASEAAKTIRKACSLNIGSCYLKLEDYEKCIKECTSVTSEFGADLKAHYRRGQAYAGLRRWRRANEDLSRALKLCPADASERAAMREKLQEVKDQLSWHRANGGVDSDPEPEPEPVGNGNGPASSFKIEEVFDEPSTTASRVPSSGSPATRASGQVKETLEFLQKNPEKANEMADMLSSMPPEQLQQMMRAAGAPEGFNATPEMMKFAMDAMKNLSPEDLDRMSRSMPRPGGGGGAFSGGSSSPLGVSAPSASTAPLPVPDMAAMMSDPNMMKNAAAMMRNLDSATLAKIMSSTGVSTSPEQAEAMASKMRGLTDAQLAALMSVASYAQRALSAARAVRAWARRNWMLVVALLLVLVGVWLRRYM